MPRSPPLPAQTRPTTQVTNYCCSTSWGWQKEPSEDPDVRGIRRRHLVLPAGCGVGPTRIPRRMSPDSESQSLTVLDETETFEINREIVAAAYEMVFQHPDDDIASTIKVPPWWVVPKAESVVDPSRRPTRWLNDPNPPAPPVSRWYSMDVPPNRSSSLKGASSSAAICSCQ
jgi:hypothetical protein